MVEPVRGWGGAYLPVASGLCVHQEPAGVLLRQVNLRGCFFSELLRTDPSDRAVYFSEEDEEEEEEEKEAAPPNTADEDAVKESSETESAGQSQLWKNLFT